MFRNHLVISWRTIIRNKGYTILNVLGFSLGLCACIILFLDAHYELSFDNFHPDKARIYRVTSQYREKTGNVSTYASLPLPALTTLQAGLTGVDVTAGIKPYGPQISIPEERQVSRPFDSWPSNAGYPLVGIAQKGWFDLFHYEWLAGKVSTEPYTVVLTESRAHLYFGPGDAADMLGRIVLYDSIPMHVSGIVKDWTENTDLGFTDLISFSSFQTSYFQTANQDSWKPDGVFFLTFIKLSQNHSPEAISAQAASLVKGHDDPSLRLVPVLDPLSDLHFNGRLVENPIRTAHLPTLYALMGITLFILLIAVINFINLSTAQSLQRAKEVGVRKVLGGSRSSLVAQFLIETFILTSIAILEAVAIVNPTLYFFRTFLPPGLSFHIGDPAVLVFLLLMAIVTTLLAGLYPAKVLSSYIPIVTLKGASSLPKREKWYLRKGLIVFQFTVSLIFIISSIVIARQMSHIRHKDLGFVKDAIITIETPGSDSLSKVRVAAEKIRHLSAVDQVALQWAGPGNAKSMIIRCEGTDDKDMRAAQVDGDEHLVSLYGLKLLAGRDLSRTDSVNEFIVNETLARIMGCHRPEEAIGKTIVWLKKSYPIVGVAADFYPNSLHSRIGPACIINRVDRERTIVVKINNPGKNFGALNTVLDQLQRTWRSVYPDAVFTYRFYDETLGMAYQKDEQTGMLMNSAMALTIIISCIGLFGLAMFTVERRTREIGIRKVMGASVINIMSMLTKDIVVLITLAALIASPIAWYCMNDWLKGFADRITISPWIFVAGELSALFLGLSTVSYHAIRAARQNPVKSLRTE